MDVGSISIVSGWLPVFVFWVAVCLIAVVLRRDVLREFAIGIPAGVIFVVLLFVGLHRTGAVPTGAPRSLYVWLTVAWFARSHLQLPVIELLHGTPGDPSDWTRAIYADATSVAFAEQHHGMAPILVVPDVNGSFGPDTQCINSTMFGDVETHLTKTVPHVMQKNFNASTTPGSLAMAGLSEGGLRSVTLALNNSRQIPVFADYSGDESPTHQYTSKQQTIQASFGGSVAAYNAHNPPYLLTHQRYTGLAGWLEVRAQDSEGLQPIQTLQGLASKAGIDTCIATPPGGHDFGLRKQAFSDSLPWLSPKLKLTPQPPSVPAHCVPGTS